VPDTRTNVGVHQNPWLFGSLKPIDISTKGDGAGDNVAGYSQTLDQTVGEGMIGVTALKPLYGDLGGGYFAYGQAVLRSTDVATGDADGGADVGIVSSDEPTFKHRASYAGRAVLFSFGFEGINDNTGYATRDQVMTRIFQWFDDHPSVQVASASYVAGKSVTLRARLTASPGVRAATYAWQVGGVMLKPSKSPTQYRFPHAGRYRLRVLITDGLGHAAVSAWKTVTVR
jgi:hypothetical protein